MLDSDRCVYCIIVHRYQRGSVCKGVVWAEFSTLLKKLSAGNTGYVHALSSRILLTQQKLAVWSDTPRTPHKTTRYHGPFHNRVKLMVNVKMWFFVYMYV